MVSEYSVNPSEGSSVIQDRGEWVTVRDATIQENVSEKSIYNRIKSGYYETKIENGTRLVLLKRKPYASVPSSVASVVDAEEFSELSSERTEGIQNQSSEIASERLIEFMDRTFDRVESYNRRNEDLIRENEKYKLLTDSHSRTLESLEKEIDQLKTEVFQRDARIKELAHAIPDIELSARIKQLEAQLVEKDEKIHNLETELTDLKSRVPGWMFWKK